MTPVRTAKSTVMAASRPSRIFCSRVRFSLIVGSSFSGVTRFLFQLRPQLCQAISQNGGVLEFQHLRRAAPRSSRSAGIPSAFHLRGASELPLAPRFCSAKRSYGTLAPGRRRRLLQLRPQLCQTVSQNGGVLELQHLRRAAPRSSAPRGPPRHFTCAGQVNCPLRRGFAPQNARAAHLRRWRRRRVTSAAPAAPSNGLSKRRRTRTPASSPPLSSASPPGRSPQ